MSNYEYHEYELEPNSDIVRKAAGLLAFGAFLIDLLLMIVLIASLLEFKMLTSAQPLEIQFMIISLVFVLAIGMFVYARSAYGDMYEGVVYVLFGWGYVLLSAVLLAIVARKFVVDVEVGWGLLEFLIYSVASAFVSSFGIIIARIVDEERRYFVLLFFPVLLWQLGLWAWRIISQESRTLGFGWNIVGSLMLFFYLISLVVFLVRESPSQDEDVLDM